MPSYYSPLRYPGGKGKLSQYFQKLIQTNQIQDGCYIEPYCGGAGVALSLLLADKVGSIYLNDLNYPVYCFWHSVLKNPDLLCEKIAKCSPTVTEWQKQRDIYQNSRKHEKVDVGYALLFLNRTNRSGILSGHMIGGHEQSGTWKIDARFYKETIISRIQAISNKKKSIKIYNMDAISFLEKHISKFNANALIYIDPPYYHKGQRLYDNFYTPSDHRKIYECLSKIRAKWVLSYDNCPEILTLYKRYRSTSYKLNYSAASHQKGSEVMIYSGEVVLPNTNRPMQRHAA